MAYCSECGRKIKDHSRYCSHCGAPVDENVGPDEVGLSEKKTAAGYTVMIVGMICITVIILL
ncbi:MAG TPA: zinc ribbon domain-containing protein [Candidatus Ruminococcus avistercoris]|nr:zinc ribbon domain-containing protein [Candidatus Ruminococcus avistercoris]